MKLNKLILMVMKMHECISSLGTEGLKIKQAVAGNAGVNSM